MWQPCACKTAPDTHGRYMSAVQHNSFTTQCTAVGCHTNYCDTLQVCVQVFMLTCEMSMSSPLSDCASACSSVRVPTSLARASSS